MTIADRIRPMLSPLLAQALDTRTEEGLRKYGQTLDQNIKPDRAKTVHFVQETLDASQYNEWKGSRPEWTLTLCQMANEAAAEFPDLTLDELLFKEGHSGVGTRVSNSAEIIWEGEFVSYQHWINQAKRAIGGRDAICVDAQGRRCFKGQEFMRARDEDAFPVRYGWNTQPVQSSQAAEHELDQLQGQHWFLQLDHEGSFLLLSELHADLLAGTHTDEDTATLGRLLDSWQKRNAYSEMVEANAQQAQEIGELKEALAAMTRQHAAESLQHDDTVDQRDRAREAADRLACALYDVEEIGEHTNLNDPWANAAERLEALAQAPAGISEKAALWDALLGAARLRPLGWAGTPEDENDPVTHFGMEFWTRYPGYDLTEANARGRQVLTSFARAVLTQADEGDRS